MNEEEYRQLKLSGADKWFEIEEARIRRGLFAKEMHPLTEWPPLNYRGNVQAKLREQADQFKEILSTKLPKIMSYDLYDEEIYDKLLAPVRTSIEEARMYRARYKDVSEATKAYIKDNPKDNLDIDDFWT